MLEVNVTRLAEHDKCEFAKHRYNGIARWRFLWTLLIFIFGAFLVVIVAGALVLALASEPTAAIITAIGGVVDGAGVLFLISRRKESKQEEEAAYRDVKAMCTDASAAVDATRRSLRVLGVR